MHSPPHKVPIRKGDGSPPPAGGPTRAHFTHPDPILASPRGEGRGGKSVRWGGAVASPRRRAVRPLQLLRPRLQYPSELGGAGCPEALPPPTVAGRWDAMTQDERLFKLQTFETEEYSSVFFYNATRDTCFRVEYTFSNESQLRGGDSIVKQEGQTFSCLINPGCTVHFVSGRIYGYKLKLGQSAPSPVILAQEASEAESKSGALLFEAKETTRRRGGDPSSSADVLDHCAATRTPFVDPAFPPCQASIGHVENADGPLGPLPWWRPCDYLPSSVQVGVFLGEAEVNDIDQGLLGDCYLLCALAALAEEPSMVRRIFRAPTDYAAQQQVGGYHVLLCATGWWRDVVVDTFLPCCGKEPAFAHNIHHPGELWCGLVEKAVAKTKGSYQAIQRGDSIESLRLLTGCPTERIDWRDAGAFERLSTLVAAGCIVVLHTPGHNTRCTAIGLLPGYSYALLETRPSHRICRIRNAWGDATLWTGRWSDHHHSWQQHPDVLASVDSPATPDGTFWMEWDDVLQWFDGGGVCHLLPKYYDVRLATEAQRGFAMHMVEVWVEKPGGCYIGLHQRDDAPLMITVVAPISGQGWHVITGGQSAGGKYLRGKAVYLHYDFPASQRPYYIMWRCKDPVTVQVVMSLQCETRLGTLAIRRPSRGSIEALSMVPIWQPQRSPSFDPTMCPKTAAYMQFNSSKEQLVSGVDMAKMHAPY